MFSKIWNWIKAHPWETGLIVIGGILLAGLLSGFFGGGSNQSNAATGPSDAIQAAEIQASAQLQSAEIAAGVQNTNTQSQNQLGLAYLNEQQTVALAQDQLQLDLTNANNQASIEALQLQVGATALTDLGNLDALAAKGPVGSFSQDRSSLVQVASSIFNKVGQVSATPSTVNAVLTGTPSTTVGQSQSSAPSVSAPVANVGNIGYQLSAGGIFA